MLVMLAVGVSARKLPYTGFQPVVYGPPVWVKSSSKVVCACKLVAARIIIAATMGNFTWVAVNKAT